MGRSKHTSPSTSHQTHLPSKSSLTHNTLILLITIIAGTVAIGLTSTPPPKPTPTSITSQQPQQPLPQTYLKITSNITTIDPSTHTTNTTIGMDGDVNLYPFEEWTIEGLVTATIGGKKVPLILDIGGRVHGFEAGTEVLGMDGGVMVTLTIRRSWAVRVFAVIVLIKLWGLAVGATLYTGMDDSVLAVHVGMLFALPGLRSTLPGAPAIGCLVDLVCFVWVMGILAGCVCVHLKILSQRALELSKATVLSGVVYNIPKIVESTEQQAESVVKSIDAKVNDAKDQFDAMADSVGTIANIVREQAFDSVTTKMEATIKPSLNQMETSVTIYKEGMQVIPKSEDIPDYDLHFEGFNDTIPVLRASLKPIDSSPPTSVSQVRNGVDNFASREVMEPVNLMRKLPPLQKVDQGTDVNIII
ncbi:hypothetical protein BCR33DRAFT_725145 [Rhizoclosmatium globosum]|uniref:Uncharacterized protein n=1 Tax=Rhizoclosmatium globosum TaxID=329046 RepID=A0A1Y2B0S2_9FUNG|nr:hypothetical protein BCR33DRAFT_725145 [Rhizoclosmatium globosum]|eukprot:ORY28439.1 hypothetical protein BCR33DRAFT_725145 [Rhizoclosmatium globosum]